MAKSKQDTKTEAKKKVRKKPRRRPMVEGKGSGIISYAVKIILILLIVFLALAAAAIYWHGMEAEKQSAAQLHSTVESVANRLSDSVNIYADLAERLSHSEDLKAALRARDEAVLSEKSASLTALIPEALRVRLILPEDNDPDTEETPHLGFASIDLIKRTLKSRTMLPLEVHQYGQQHAHVAIVAGVYEQGVALGAIHISLPLFQFNGMLDGVEKQVERLALQQKLSDGKVLTFADTRPGGAEAIPDVESSVAHSIWQVAGWKAESSGLNQQKLIGVALGAGLLLSALAVWLLLRGLSSALTSDLGNMVKLNEEFHAGGNARRYPMRWRETDAAMALIVQKLHEVESQRVQQVGVQDDQAAGAPKKDAPGLDDDFSLDLDQPELGGLAEVEAVSMHLPDNIFREYDIRGRVGEELSREAVYEIGRAIGSEAHDAGQQTVSVARDGRDSSPELTEALVEGLMASGRDVIDLGMTPTPLLYFATHFLGSNTGVMVTGSHNPPEYNGLKVVMDGDALYGQRIHRLQHRVERGDFTQGEGSRQDQDLIPDYIGRVCSDVKLARSMKIVIDCGSSVPGLIAPELFKRLGCEVVPLYCDVRGDFPYHHPDPSKEENLQDLINEVREQGADLGLAFDGDGDRLGVVDSGGKIIWPDRLLMLFARDVLARMPGSDVIYDVKSTRNLASDVLTHGGRPVMSATGHSLLKAKMKETGALLAGEYSGHILFNDRWYGFDDALYAGARLLEILTLDPRPAAQIFAELPESVTTGELSAGMPEGMPRALVKRIEKMAEFKGARVINIDGLRVEFEDGWGLVRASNTTPNLLFRFEADTEESLDRIQSVFREQISKIQPGIKLPY